ncbi:S-adenosyl-L-methionine-dependent methyltransferase superfamily protein [Forsythia ovata]|uniref:S-adenosyl-L-methionine-dependent methyltransferase superfamily protein n=1 Tax=Forsythia ovata TaxID=205694 RepID=A0ABD1V0P4_9LAMI
MAKKQHSIKKQEELLKTLGDFTSKENWDQFFTIRGSDDSFEWYAEWPQLRDILKTHLSSSSPPLESSAESGRDTPHVALEEVRILVPGCGNSRLSEHLYDLGFRNITNVDFSKVVISDMLRKNVRDRPEMKWRVMDMTSMQFVNESFDAILDKGGLDALMEPKLGPRLGNEYLSEVKRILKVGGKFICLTLAECHVLELLFPKFRFGWKLSLYAIPQKPSGNHKLQTFMVIAEKDNSTVVSQISSFIDQSSTECSGSQAREFFKALERENEVRSEYSRGSDIFHSLEDLKLGSKGNLEELNPGRRVQLTLGEPGLSRFSYKAVILDAQQESGPFMYHCGVFLVPKTRAHEWLFSSEEGQWLVVESSKAARLVMILLDSSNSNGSMDDIQKDLSPLVKQLAPGDCDNGAQIPFMAASDGIKQRNIVHKATSALTGPIIVDDVIYEKIDDDLSHRIPFNDVMFRRLIFQRSEGLVQSEALLLREGPHETQIDIEKKRTQSASKSRRKGNQKRFGSHAVESLNKASRSNMKVDHNYLASSYHNGIISGFILISSYLERISSAGGSVKAIVIGLGAGLLPMFLHKCLPILEIEVVELDPVVLDVARDYFSFGEDKHLKVHITDGIKFVREIVNFEAADASTTDCGNENDTSNGNVSNGSSIEVHADGRSSNKIDILIIDVDSSDLSSGLTCPASEFVEESFLLTVKYSLSEQGLFVINLVSRSSAVKDKVFSRLQTVFSNIFSLQLEEDLNEVIFALNDSPIEENQFSEACDALARLLELEKPEWSQSIIDGTKLIKRLR